MLFMVLLTIMLAAVVVATAWSAIKDSDEADQPAEPAPVPAPSVPESLEGVLARQVLTGEITGPQYRRAVRRLAERDADRHPLAVPEE